MVSIIILIQNRFAEVERCLKSIITYSTTPYELVLIMQAVTDEKVLALVNSLPGKVTLLFNETNTGITPGRNQGIEAAKGEYLLFFDDDAYVDDNTAMMNEDDLSLDWLGRLTQYFQNPDVGIVSQSGSFINPQKMGIFYAAQHRGEPCDVGQGYCYMFSRAVVNTIGGLDPYFGKFWHEESEYALRAKASGFRVINAGYIGVMHIGSGSGDDGTYVQKIQYIFNKWGSRFEEILEYPRWATVHKEG